MLPTVFGVDPDGPDRDGTLYLHGSVAARSLLAGARTRTSASPAPWSTGLVLARSGFHHSMNYRSAVVIGRGRLVDDADEKVRALDLVVDHVVPGRSATLRAHTRKELAATTVIALPLHEASVKKRAGRRGRRRAATCRPGSGRACCRSRSPPGGSSTATDSQAIDVPGRRRWPGLRRSAEPSPSPSAPA